MTLRTRQLLAKFLNPLYPGYGGCLRCERNWRICHAHTTDYRPENGCFPLCEECWQELSIEARLPYYRMLWNSWGAYASGDVERVDLHTGEISTLHLPTREDDLETLRLIEEAVRQGR